jgi:anti-anti-sigma factor
MGPPPVFQLRRERDGDVVRLWLAGDFDQAQRDTVIDALDEGPTPAEIVIEMSQVGFMGSAGLSTLIHACRMLQPDGGRVVLLDPAGPVIRLLDTCGLTHLFAIQLS